MPVTTRRQSLAAASPGGKPVARTPTATPVKAAKSKKAIIINGRQEELWRKVFHVLPGLVTYALWKTGHNPRHVAVVIFAMTVVVAGFEWWRLRSKSVNKSYLGLFGFMMRRSESSEPHSTMYYLVGVTFSLLAYSTEIAVCSILFLAFCDPAATLFGRCLGHLGPRLSSSKSLAGSLGAAAVGAAVAANVLALAGWEHWATAGAIAAISEALPVPGVGRGPAMMDDNLVIPVVSGALLTACRLGP